MVAIALLGGISFFVKPFEQISRQAFRNQPSWIFYLLWSVVLSLFVFAIHSYVNKPSLVELNNLARTDYVIYLCVILILVVSKWIIEYLFKDVLIWKPTQFASGSVGLDGDQLGFATSAKNTADGLIKLSDYVNVVGVYGRFGFGKSSYARMVIESLNTNNTLYTYISLTETNEAKDFSKLFAERWLETLSGRYPKIDITSSLPYMDSILRESGNGIVSDILRLLAAFNRGLVQTKAKFFDSSCTRKPKYTSDRVGRLFGNISDITEDVWVVMIDEIERAQFDEIYRVVEIIERFKNEGRSGLPVKLLFLFCISEPEMEKYLNKYEGSDPRAHLLKTFFYADPKSISHRIFLPPVEPEVKLKFVLDLFNQVVDREGIKILDEDRNEIKNISAHQLGNPDREFMNHQKALEYIVGTLQESSPRDITRIRYVLDFFYGAFKDSFGELDKNGIRFSDILALEYIKLKHPYLIDFFSKTIFLLVNQAESGGMSTYFLKKDLENNKKDLIGWIEQVTEVQIPETEKETVKKLVGLVAYSYLDFLEKDYERDTKYQYTGSTSYPEVMADYLTLLSDGTQTSYRKNNRIYQSHKGIKDGVVAELDNKDLISYTRFIFGVRHSPSELNVDLILELGKRIATGMIAPEPMNIENTTLDEATYQFVFQIVALMEKERDALSPSENIKNAYESLNLVLSSEKLPTNIKFLALSSLVNNERGSGSSIHFRLDDAFKKLRKYYGDEIKTLIQSVFTEYDERYLSGGNVLYSLEENFFFTMYQGWSGLSARTDEIEQIRNVAKRDLIKYPVALKHYWRKYPAKKGWKTLDDVFEADHFFSTHDVNNPLYMPLESLLQITKEANIQNDEELTNKLTFWESIKNDSRLKDIATTIKDDNDTLRSFLIRHDFLEKIKDAE
ncbi:MAG: P-loop NTPase fold protein [Minisyncoccia bacterium]